MSTNEKRVGASVIPSAPTPNTMIPPPPLFPMVLYDDRHRHHHRRRHDCSDSDDDDRDVAITTDITRHTVPGNSTITVGLTSAAVSVGEARVSGNAIILPHRGDYRVHVNITMATVGDTVSVLVNGGVGGGTIITTAATGVSVYTGTITMRASSRQERISVMISNGGTGSIQILGGTISAQLV